MDEYKELSVKDYAELHGLEIKTVKDITGLTHHNQKVTEVMDDYVQDFLGKTADSSEEQKPEPTAKASKAPTNGFLARRAAKIEAAQKKSSINPDGTMRNHNQFNPADYEGMSEAEYAKLPGRIRRNIEAQKSAE